MRPGSRRGVVSSSALALLLGAGCRAEARPEEKVANPLPSDPSRRVEWPVYGGDPGGLRYSILQDITPANVADLKPAWEWRTGERVNLNTRTGRQSRPDRFQATPLMLGDTLYLSTPLNRAVALDANTGRELWKFDPGAEKWGETGLDHATFVHRGIAVWSGTSQRRVFLNSRWSLFALDAGTGRPIPAFGSGGVVDLTKDLRWPVNRYRYGNTSPPVVWRDLVVVGSSIPDRLVQDRPPTGEVQAFDVHTGKRVWSWDPVARTGEPGAATWEAGASERIGHANVWAPFTVDTARGLLYLPVSSATNDWYGGRRKGDGLYGESLVCLDARTGRVVWHFQLVHHGLWDYDPATPPILLSLPHDGRRIDAVALPGKTGFVYVFDRLTGRPLWSIDEHPVPASDVPGEAASLTQPVPLWPPPFARQGISDSDLVDFTPELREMARSKVRGSRLGPIFTPPSLAGTVVMPGWIGGAGWGGGAFDSTTGTLYVKATNRPALARLTPAGSQGYILDPSLPPDEALDLTLRGRGGFLGLSRADVRIPLVRPPYGTLTAIDLTRGVIRWQVTLGDTPAVRFHSRLRFLNLPALGVAGAPGPMVTRSGLVFLTGGGEVLYAIDASSGAVLWSFELGRIGYANPMTYRTASGRQFVVIATGQDRDARLMSFSLPHSQAKD